MIAITGAAGQLGSQIIRHLLAQGTSPDRIIAVDRESPAAAELADLGVSVRFADYDHPETLPAAFAGAEKVLLISSPAGSDATRITQHRAVIDAAAAAQVTLFAYTSVTRAPTNTMALAHVHRATEEAIAASDLPAVILRNGWYAENHTVALPRAVATGVLVGSAGSGRMAAVARADLAEAAAIVLTHDEDQAGRTYDLTGDTTWTLADLAAEAATQTGTPVAYTDLPPDQYTAILNQAGLPEPVVSLIVDSDVAIANGTLDYVSNELTTLLGRPLTSMSACVAAAVAN